MNQKSQRANYSFIAAVLVVVVTFVTPDLLSAQQTIDSPPKDAPKVEIHKLVDLAGAKNLGLKTRPLEQIDIEMSKQVTSKKIIGCSALIFKDGKEVYYGQWGQRDARKGLPIQRDTIFRIYSI